MFSLHHTQERYDSYKDNLKEDMMEFANSIICEPYNEEKFNNLCDVLYELEFTHFNSIYTHDICKYILYNLEYKKNTPIIYYNTSNNYDEVNKYILDLIISCKRIYKDDNHHVYLVFDNKIYVIRTHN